MRQSLFKNRKAQVFLLLAIVILIYLILLSTTVYRITQSPYVNPAPNQKQLSNYIDNSITAIQDLAEASLSHRSTGATRNEIIVFVLEGLNDIEYFLDNHNLPSVLSLDEVDFSISNTSSIINPVSIQTKFNVTLQIDSPDVYYDGTFLIDITYYVEISDTTGSENYIYLYKINNGIKSMINNGILDINPSTPISNMGDGSYSADLQLGQTIMATFPHNIILWMEI
ncbi:MAG: hypothetical protein H7645_01720 [Candidatus Heimdallarchaeota archaeon]|nr:hypothetical protein [Candidatus Heimdallarchaeota archaeon]MCK4769035.1 hypothetical protein [Candidatus Heimdallarchaeota archaeon]